MFNDLKLDENDIYLQNEYDNGNDDELNDAVVLAARSAKGKKRRENTDVLDELFSWNDLDPFFIQDFFDFDLFQIVYLDRKKNGKRNVKTKNKNKIK